METIEREVRSFIVENYLFGNEDEAPGSEDSFLDSGLIDSTGMLELVMFLEEQYDIKIADEQLTPENLDSIRKIAHFIGQLRG